MIWLTWRQFRAQGATALAILIAAVAYFLISGLNMHHAYAADLVSCTPQHDCADVLDPFRQSYDAAFHLTSLLLVIVPALIGIFWGAPLIARELETGTHQLVWNQSVTRSRWLAVKLSGVGLASIVTAGLLSYLLTWWAGPLDHILTDRFAAMTFASRDVVPAAYAFFAFALGAAAGLILRRTLAAMAVTLALFIGIQIMMATVIRPNLLSSTTVSYPVDPAVATQASGIYTSGGGAEIFLQLPVPRGAWVISAPPMEDSAGRVVPAYSHSTCLFPDTAGPGAKSGAPAVGPIVNCLARYDLHQSVTYQPASHYWPLQWFESGILLAVAGVFSGTSFWWIRRRRS